ncbi:MAG: MFS transporter [Deltaproteobacteria bacterium]|nr:MFS transporter [Deltaproteobacteria bacterium]
MVASRKVPIFLAACSFGVLGACLTLPGTLLPILVEHFHLRLVEAGSMMALQGVGYLLAVVATPRLIGRFGMRCVLVTSLLISAAGLAGFGHMSNWIGGASMMFVTGLGFGAMEVTSNTLLLAIGGERRANLLNFTHLFFGVGSFIAPALTTRAVDAGISWQSVFFAAGVITASVGLGWRAMSVQHAAATPSEFGTRDRGARRSPMIALLAIALGAYVGAEIGIGGWLTKYMVSEYSVTLTYAGTVLSFYWLGMAAGRLALTVLAHRVRDELLLIGLAACATLAGTAALLGPGPMSAAVCFALTGLGFSGIFPAAIALAGRCYPHDTAAVTSRLIAGAAVGGICIPWIMSAIADGFGLVAGMSFYAFMTAVVTALTVAVKLAVSRLERRPAQAP